MSLNEIKIPKNMNYQKEEFESKNLDHLGIIDEIGIVEKINEISGHAKLITYSSPNWRMTFST